MRKKYKIQFYVPGFCNSVLSSLRRTLVRFVNNRANAKTVYFLLYFLCMIVFSSCTKIINVKINEAAKKIVIEGTISYGDTAYPEVKNFRNQKL